MIDMKIKIEIEADTVWTGAPSDADAREIKECIQEELCSLIQRDLLKYSYKVIR